MTVRWTEEEKTLLNMKKIIAAVWRMNSEQMRFYCRKLQKKQLGILPGRLGSVFLKKLEWISVQETGQAAKIWPQLMKDTECLLKLIHCDLDERGWLTALPKLETQQKTYFKTELGAAFILDLKEKLGIDMPAEKKPYSRKVPAKNDLPATCLDEKKELEKIAGWLMESTGGQSTEPEKKKEIFFTERFRKAVVMSFACMSACFMCVWLHGQIGRNMDQWSLHQMKVSASGNAEVPLVKNLETGTATDVKKQQKDTSPAVKKIKIQPEDGRRSRPEKLPQYKKMSKEYPKLYGWLQIPGTQIDFPVMRAEGDRNFYLDHDFSGMESAEGALFVDEKNSIYPPDGNTVVYGHNMKNGHMFGTLKMYLDEEFFREHRKIHFDTVYETGIYEVVAVLKTRILNENEPGFRYYRFFQYQTKEEFQECQDFVEKNRIFETGTDLQYGDQILMLSTCEYSQENGRLVVVARKSCALE